MYCTRISKSSPSTEYNHTVFWSPTDQISCNWAFSLKLLVGIWLRHRTWPSVIVVTVRLCDWFRSFWRWPNLATLRVDFSSFLSLGPFLLTFLWFLHSNPLLSTANVLPWFLKNGHHRFCNSYTLIRCKPYRTVHSYFDDDCYKIRNLKWGHLLWFFYHVLMISYLYDARNRISYKNKPFM